MLFVKRLDLSPHAIIEEGERGTVTRYDAKTGDADIELHNLHHDLREYNNCIWLIPPDTGEIEAAIIVESSTEPLSS